MNLGYFIVVIIFVIFLLNHNNIYSGNVIYKYDDNHLYHVNNDQSDESKQLVVNTLHKLRENIDYLIDKLRNQSNQAYINKYNISRDKVEHLCNVWSSKYMQIEELNDNYLTKPNIFAYNVNKGESISICVKNKQELNKTNELMFVLLHELAHIMTSDYAHDEMFWNSFRYLIKESEDYGLYNNINYQNTPHEFCNMQLRHNPTF